MEGWWASPGGLMPNAAVAQCTAPDRELRIGEASGAETARAASCTPAASAECYAMCTNTSATSRHVLARATACICSLQWAG